MTKLRVHELAKELNIESKILMAKLKEMGAKVLSHQSTLTDQQASELRGALGASAGASHQTAATASATATDSSGKPKVVIRRRVAAKDDEGLADVADFEPAQQAAAEVAHEAPAGDSVQDAELADAYEAEPLSADVAAEASSADYETPAVEAEPIAQEEADVDHAAASAPPTPSPRTIVTPTTPVVRAAASSATVVRSVQRPTASVVRPAQARPAGVSINIPKSTPKAAPVQLSAEPTARREESPRPVASRQATEVTAAAPQTASGGVRPQVPDTLVLQTPPVQAAGASAAPSAATGEDAQLRRRREMGGATIVRKASAEEVEKLEIANRSRQTGRKEDHRGTRVTGLGLLSNRISGESLAPGAAPSGAAGVVQQGGQAANTSSGQGPGGPPQSEFDEWGNRRAATAATGVKDKKTLDDEEQARKKAAAKARRTQGVINTRLLLQQAEILTSDEEVAQTDFAGRTVYTPMAPRTKRDIKRRKDLKKTSVTMARASYRVVSFDESITVGELARQLAVKSTDVIKKLMAQGVMATINQEIDFDTASLVAGEYQFEVKNTAQTVEEIMSKEVDSTNVQTFHRPPIVTVMGHVDHGKTSILDAIRSSSVASGEAGGITQHIGAYSVEHHGHKIAFLDTPGHEAFSAMRARGAKVTDIVVLVVAADDGVMPQTIEAINHAKAANVPLIVAVNKVDKPNINLDRVYTELTEHGVQAEEWGGETQFIKTSALKRQGIDELLDAILLQSEVLDLKASRDGFAEGAVIEAHLDKGRGPVATIMVQAGTIKAGDYIVAGIEYGRVRAMHDYTGKDVAYAGPSEPVEIIGLSGVPRAGDRFNIVTNERTAREAAAWRVEQARKAQSTKSSAASLADLLAKVKNQDVPEVPMIVKGDTQGSVEAIIESILKLNTDRVKNRIIHSGVGGVTESDITLADASGAVIIGFSVRAARGLDELAEKNGVVVQYFSIIYEIVDAVKALMVGKLPPIISEVVLGRAEVRKPISVPKIGTIGGSAVLSGKITRSSSCRLIRNEIVIYSGKIGSLRRFKDDVKEVLQSYECGIGIDGYNDLKEGDIIEAFVLEESAATL